MLTCRIMSNFILNIYFWENIYKKNHFWLVFWAEFPSPKCVIVTFTYLFICWHLYVCLRVLSKYFICFLHSLWVCTQISEYPLCNPIIANFIQINSFLDCICAPTKNAFQEMKLKNAHILFMIILNFYFFCISEDKPRGTAVCVIIGINIIYNERYMRRHNPYRKQRIFND